MLGTDTQDTIVAVASPPGSGVRGIIRACGPNVLRLADKLFEVNQAQDEPPADLNSLARATSVDVSIPIANESLATLALSGHLLIWPNERSYTRQPTIEFHTIGSPPLLNSVVQSFCEAGARLAQPGEFTLRAFLSGRIDLTQAEAVLAVIDAQGDQDLKHALRQLAGGLAGPLTELRDGLINLLAELEAGLDFVEEDIEFISVDELNSQLSAARERLQAIVDQIDVRNLYHQKSRIVFYGLPNAGKSSLFNYLAGSERAIVADELGTTRDFLSADISLNGLSLEIVDTAGIEEALEASDTGLEIQQIMNRANELGREQVEQAECRVLCIDASQSGSFDSVRLERLAKSADLIVFAKSDLIDLAQRRRCRQWATECGFTGELVFTSVLDGSGITRLGDAIAASLLSTITTEQPVVGTTAVRAATSLERAAASLTEASNAVKFDLGLELVAAEVRTTLNEIGEVVGVVYTDDILDRIFSRFCIGK